MDAFLLEHDSARAPSIVYWSNVLLAVVVWPLLVLKWVVVTGTMESAVTTDVAGCSTGRAREAQREAFELGLVVILSCALLAIAVLYYTFFDSAVGEKASLRFALRRHRRSSSRRRECTDAQNGSCASTRATATMMATSECI